MPKTKKTFTDEDVNATYAIRACVAIKDCELLTDDIKVRAIKDIIGMIGKDNSLLDIAGDYQLRMYFIFTWCDSKEGFDFWNRVNHIVGPF